MIRSAPISGIRKIAQARSSAAIPTNASVGLVAVDHAVSTAKTMASNSCHAEEGERRPVIASRRTLDDQVFGIGLP